MKVFSILILTCIFLFGCKKNNTSSKEVLETIITSISSPENAIVGDNVKITVHFTGINGCAQPHSIEANKVGQTIQLRAFYSIEEEQICTQAVTNLALDYSFFADLPGPYFFIYSNDNSVADTLVVI